MFGRGIWRCGFEVKLAGASVSLRRLLYLAAQGLKSLGEVVGGDEVAEVLPALVMAVVVVTLDGRVFDGAVRSLDLAVVPGVSRLGQAMFDAEIGACGLQGVAPDGLVLRSHPLMSSGVQPAPVGSVKCVPQHIGKRWFGSRYGPDEDKAA